MFHEHEHFNAVKYKTKTIDDCSNEMPEKYYITRKDHCKNVYITLPCTAVNILKESGEKNKDNKTTAHKVDSKNDKVQSLPVDCKYN